MWHLIIAFVVCILIASAAMWLSFKLPLKKEPVEELSTGTDTPVTGPEPPAVEETSGPAESPL